MREGQGRSTYPQCNQTPPHKTWERGEGLNVEREGKKENERMGSLFHASVCVCVSVSSSLCHSGTSHSLLTSTTTHTHATTGSHHTQIIHLLPTLALSSSPLPSSSLPAACCCPCSRPDAWPLCTVDPFSSGTAGASSSSPRHPPLPPPPPSLPDPPLFFFLAPPPTWSPSPLPGPP